MSRTTLTLLIVVGLLAALSSWLSREKEAGPLTQARTLPHVPDYYVNGFSASVYSAAGQPRHHLSAEQMIHYADDRSTELQRPQLLFASERGERWQLDAGEGTLDGSGDILQLKQAVTIRSSNDSNPFELKTEALTVETRAQRATTRSDITINAPRTHIEAAGLDADFAAEKLVLYSVRGRYEP